MYFNMEYYLVKYAGQVVKSTPAHSIYHAIDKVYGEYIGEYPNINRKQLTAKKL